MQPRTRQSLAEQIVRILAGRIADGSYPLGARLPSEHEMTAEFGVSRTVVREAVANLRATGLVATAQGRGAFVVRQKPPEVFRIEETGGPPLAEIVSAMELRIAFESEAAILAAARRTPAHLAALAASIAEMDAAIAAGEDAVPADMRFHRCIAEATGNPHFVRLFDCLGDGIIPRTRLPSFRAAGGGQADYLRAVLREHEQIFHAIELSDPEAARAALRLHLTGSRLRLVKMMDGGA
ncbi:MAG: FadR/GntR family transcriptional regulator [Rhodospirillaceae bacterium]